LLIVSPVDNLRFYSGPLTALVDIRIFITAHYGYSPGQLQWIEEIKYMNSYPVENHQVHSGEEIDLVACIVAAVVRLFAQPQHNLQFEASSGSSRLT
jgi:hypothetical protein